MTAFGVLVFIAVTVLLGATVYTLMRRKNPSAFGRAFEGYGLVVLVVAWVFLLVGLTQGAFSS